MNQILTKLTQAEVDVNSLSSAGRFAATFTNNEWSKNRFENLIKDFFGVEFTAAFNKEAEVVFRYMVIEAVKAHLAKQDVVGETLLVTAQAQTAKFFKNFPWSHPSHSSQLAKSDFDEEGNYIGSRGYDETLAPEDIKIGRTTVGGKTVKPKKGAKQHAAKAIYDANVGKSNQEIIALFMSQLDMSKAGATTYLYNMKKAA